MPAFTPRRRSKSDVWEQRGLHLFHLPSYSPQLNIAETLWRKLKFQQSAEPASEWLQPSDYTSSDLLFYTVRQALAAVGTNLTIRFSDFTLS